MAFKNQLTNLQNSDQFNYALFSVISEINTEFT